MKNNRCVQSLLRIKLPKTPKTLYPNLFRELLARYGDEHPLLPPAFFHYGEDGKTLAGKPDIRVVGGQNWVGILSQSGQNPLFDGAIGVASRVAAEHCGCPVAIVVEAPEFGVKFNIDSQSTVLSYFVRDLAIKRRAKSRRDMADEDLVRQVLLEGISEIASRYGFDVPPESSLNLRLHHCHCISLRLKTINGVTNEYVTLANAEFSMCCDLDGMWQAGSLQSRGYGRIIRKRPGDQWREKSVPKEVLS